MLFLIDSEDAREAAIDYLRRLPLRPVECVDIKPYRRIRSQAQNRLYWMWMRVLADWTGYEEDELHVEFRKALLGYHRMAYRGEYLMVLASTTELNTKQMTAYLDGIAIVARWLEIPLPWPDDGEYAMGRKQHEAPKSTPMPW